MPAVINVGGPVAWGLVVLLSAWAVRAGRALAGRHGKRRGEDDEAVQYDPDAPQPRLLQRLSATAVRMLIETSPLPCVVLELAEPGNSNSSSSSSNSRLQGQQHGKCRTAAIPARHHADGGAAVHPAALGRIVPPELAASVPYMTAAAWIRALASPEAWRTELSKAASAAAASTSASSSSSGSSSACGGSSNSTADAVTASSTTTTTAAAAATPVTTESIVGRETATASQTPASSSAAAQQQQQLLLRTSVHPVQQTLPATTASTTAAGGGGIPAAVATTGGEPDGSGRVGSSASASASAPSAACSLPYPQRHALLVVLGRNERAVAAVTAAAAAAGFSKVATLQGTPDAFAAASLCGPRLPTLSRSGLWLLLQLGGEQPAFHVPSALVLDVRRPDERLMYGAIRGTINIPADELAVALALPPLEFSRRYGVPRPLPAAAVTAASAATTTAAAAASPIVPAAEEAVVVLLSRSGRRAAWAAQLCVDAGLRRVIVYGEGVYGWRLEERVKPYRAFDLGCAPPDPEPFVPEEPDEAAGLQELHVLGMPLRQETRPSRFARMPTL